MEFTYPKHLQDITRKEAAVAFVFHELKKMLPSVKEQSTWSQIYQDVINWHINEAHPKPIRSFWNDINAISYHMKIKDLVPLFTSKNISWSKELINPDTFIFNTTGPDFDVILDKPVTVDRLRTFYNLSENQSLKQAVLQNLKSKENETSPRDNDPIIVVCEDSKHTILDGNRRVLRHILENPSAKLTSYIGTVVDKPKYKDQWIPTTELIKLVNLYKKALKEDLDISNYFSGVLAYLVKDSVVAQYELETRCLNIQDEGDKAFLALILSKIQEIQNISAQ